MLITPRRRRRTIVQELIAADVGGSFSCRRFLTTHWPLNWHTHPELELTSIVRGDGLRYVADSVAEFSAGDVVLLGPGVPHSWSSQPQPRRTCESLVAQFPLDVFGPAWREAAEIRPLVALVAKADFGLAITGATALAVREDLQAMVAHPPGLLRLGVLLSALGRIAAAPTGDITPLARNAVASSGSTTRRSPTDRWSALVQHLGAHADGPLATAGLAARVGLSPAAFARAFRRRFGCTCTAYLGRIRLARVCRALVETEKNIAEIAYNSGFSNLANFNRRFFEVYAMTPRAYRQRQLENEATAPQFQ